MPRLWHALSLAVAVLAIAICRADAQSPAIPSGSSPSPAAVLLPPIGSPYNEEPEKPRRSSTSYPVSDSKIERATKLKLDPNDVVSVGASVYEESRKTGEQTRSTESDERKPVSDGLAYLTEGRYRRGDEERPSRASSIWDEPAPKPVDPFAPKSDNPNFFERMGSGIRGMFGQGKDFVEDRRLFESDHSFDSFISPLSNPFYFEDPRSLTEVRPILMYQNIPGAQSLYQGGNAFFIGSQFRLAVTERWSVTINKFGYQTFEGGSGSSIPRGSGFSEFWIGPKYTFYRDKEHQSLISAGTILQIPMGPDSNYQNTGKLSIVPYVSGAMRLWETDWGTLNGMANLGYSFGTNSERADFFYTSAHIDFDINNRRRFYPLMEINWFAFTKDGTARNLPFNGRDLANIGTASSGSNLVTWTLGGKYKAPSARWEFGAGFEFPILGNRDLFQNRFTLDFIWRF
jgi:hypothetical protein